MTKILKTIFCLSLVLTLTFSTALTGGQAKAETSANDGTVSIVFTGDMHSHLDAQENIGGFAKLKTVVDEINTNYPDSFLLDAGDFSMGTPFQTIFKSEASELRMLGEMRYDVVTLGNHEFDYRPDGLTKMLNTAAQYKGTGTESVKVYEDNSYFYSWVQKTYQLMPQVVQSNIDWKATLADSELAPAAKKLKTAMDNYGVKDYVIVEKQGVKMAVFGLMGIEAISQAPESGVLWKDYIARANEIVNEIKQNGEADLILCLSHSGYYYADGEKSEDVMLAKAVPDIDVIISGHSHDVLDEDVMVGNTAIVGSGAYSDYVGHLVLKKSGDDYAVSDYSLIPLDEKVVGNPAIQAKVDAFKTLVDSEYFSKFGYEYSEVLATNAYNFTSLDTFGTVQGEDTLGNLLTDSFIYAVKKAEGKNYEQVDVAVVPKGVVRGTLAKGDVTVTDAFNISSLGIGPDGVSGYPLVSVYLTGKELKAAAEVDASVSVMMNEARLYFSGLSYTINSHRLFLNRATDIKLMLGDGTKEKLDNNKLYRVVADLYTCQMLGLVKDGSYGLLSVTPKDKDGNVIDDFEKHIIYDNKDELKAWYAVASYIDAFKGDKIPAKYSAPEGRKVLNDSWNPVALLKQPNHIGLMLAGIILIIITIIVGIVLWIRSRRKRRRGFDKSIFRAKTKRIDRPKMKIRKMKKNKYKY
jgi:2',3'-cyclic-nucleotide 2'-phosphodiesterase (5'-nucleotidase family)